MTREKTVCFTGHRPEKLSSPKEEIIDKLEKAIDQAVSEGYDTFITGLARGVDLWAGKIIIERKNSGSDLKLIAAKPFINFTLDDPLFGLVMDNADETYVITDEVCDPDDDNMYVLRDNWMVDNSSLVISVYEGREGGTKNTIMHALENGVKVIYLYDRL